MTRISKSIEDKIALEKHEMHMRMTKSIFTLCCVFALVLFGLALYSSFKTGEFPTMSDLVDLLSNVISSVLKAN